MWPACLVTSSGGNNRFCNKFNRLHKRHRTNVHHQVNNKHLCFASLFQESPPLQVEIRNVSVGFLQTPSQSKIATVLAGRWQTHSLHLWQQDVAVFCIAITIAIRKTASSCAINHFPDQANEHSKSTVVSTSCAFAPSIAKAYLQKKGTTTMKCASSAEADVFVQTVALFIAVTSQIARRCNLPVWLLLRAATIAFATKLLANLIKSD